MDPRVTEFQCIMPMTNMPSVLKHGILSFERAKKIEHESVALEEAQEKRDARQVPGGLMLHQYANLYFHARNPMMTDDGQTRRIYACCEFQRKFSRSKAWCWRTATPQAGTAGCVSCIPGNGGCWILTVSMLWTGAMRTSLSISRRNGRSAPRRSCHIRSRWVT